MEEKKRINVPSTPNIIILLWKKKILLKKWKVANSPLKAERTIGWFQQPIECSAWSEGLFISSRPSHKFV